MQRFWKIAQGYWTGERRLLAWSLTLGLAVVVLAQIALQYRINFWTRDIFDAVEQRNQDALVRQAMLMLPLALATVLLAVAAVYGRMTMQRTWRAWLVDRLLERWVARARYYRLNLARGNHQVPEGRITEDARVATDAPVDFFVGVFQAVVTAATFIGILWVVGGTLHLSIGLRRVTIPGYLVFAAVLYAVVFTTAMLVLTRRFTASSEAINQSEAEFRFALTHVRENAEGIALLGSEAGERQGLRAALAVVIERWRRYCGQHMRATVVSNAHHLLAPVLPIFLCMPRFLRDEMTLGEVTQAAAAFVQAQTAFNWLVDNFPRFADWRASVRRVGTLLAALEEANPDPDPDGTGESAGYIRRTASAGPALLQLRGLRIGLDDGSVLASDEDLALGPGEHVLALIDSGTGRSALVHALAGLHAHGAGELAVRRDARLWLMTQHPYMPLGTLRRVACYPLEPGEVGAERLAGLLRAAGIGHLEERLDREEPWSQLLSPEESQRLGIVRLLLASPEVVVMDEALSALDVHSQQQLIELVRERLPRAALLSLSQRPELGSLHERVVGFAHRPPEGVHAPGGGRASPLSATSPMAPASPASPVAPERAGSAELR